jgi:hypothetical protein
MKIETIPGAVVVIATRWAEKFVEITDSLTATETASKFSFKDPTVFKNVRDVCRILGNYNAISAVLLNLLSKKGVPESQIMAVHDVLNMYADPVDIKAWHSKE